MKALQVTEPYLPAKEKYQKYLDGIWERNWLTNNGPLVRELEEKLRSFHDLSFPVYCVANGAIGLHLIIKALGIQGEVITTPFSYVATSACPIWEGCKVVYADIDPVHLTIDPQKIEQCITPQTQAIVATHVFGNPCDVEAIDVIAKKHKLKVIYDAAHAFGVRYKGRSILEWGDASMVSTHATKLFHTGEGGFIYSQYPEVSQKLEWMRRFGHNGNEKFYGVGTNAKMSELHAAMGLAVFEDIDYIFSQRKKLVEYYLDLFAGDEAICPAFKVRENTEWNWSYYPVLFTSEAVLECQLKAMAKMQIFPRRYFYPSLNTVAEIGVSKSECSISEDIAKRIVCLPLAATYESNMFIDAHFNESVKVSANAWIKSKV